MPLPKFLNGITRKSELRLLGVTVNEDLCNWDTQFENMLSNARTRLYIPTVCNTTATHYKSLQCYLTAL